MRLFGIFVLSPSSIWRSSHDYHHNHNSKLRGSHIGSFPIMTKAQFLNTTKSKRLTYLFNGRNMRLTDVYGEPIRQIVG